MRPFRSIAIDGPSGAGKSTLAKALAARLGFLYVDTGAIYRTVGLYVARQGGDCGDPQQVLPRLPELQLSLTYGAAGLQHMLLAGEDVTQAIRENQVSRYASQVSAYPAVRAFLLEMQRNLARTHDVIMDGRDIGTVVLPNATVKIFLTATAEARAERTPPFEGYDSAQFEAGDHLIGWQNDRHATRYSHHIDDQQITDLVRGGRTFYKSGEGPVRERERFHADGRSGELNRYVILKRQ